MREYGQVQSAFWQSRDFEECSDTGRLLALYLMTGPHTNGIGCFRVTDGYVMDDLRWSQEKVSEGFAELSRNGFALRYERVVFIPNFLRWNKIANENVAKARFAEFEALPKGQSKALAARALLDYCEHCTTAIRAALETVCETVSKGYGKQNPTLPNPTQTRPEIEASPLAAEKPAAPWAAHQPIVDAYHETLPNCLTISTPTDKRRRRIANAVKLAKRVCQQQGWNYDPPTFWRGYFAVCAQDPWLRGDTPNPNNPRWRQNLDVLLADERLGEVIDKAIDAMRSVQ